MDSDVEELKALMRQNLKLSEETRDMVHDMRRSARISLIFKALYWLAILGVLSAAYVYVVSPWLQGVIQVLEGVQSAAGQAQGAGNQVQESLIGLLDSLKRLVPGI